MMLFPSFLTGSREHRLIGLEAFRNQGDLQRIENGDRARQTAEKTEKHAIASLSPEELQRRVHAEIDRRVQGAGKRTDAMAHDVDAFNQRMQKIEQSREANVRNADTAANLTLSGVAGPFAPDGRTAVNRPNTQVVVDAQNPGGSRVESGEKMRVASVETQTKQAAAGEGGTQRIESSRRPDDHA